MSNAKAKQGCVGTMALLLALSLAAKPVVAGETGWRDVAPGARMRVIASDSLGPDGTTKIGLELDMQKGTNTYWRVPGETGIPTEISLSGPNGPIDGKIAWPMPQRIVTAGFVDNVYSGRLLLPVTFTPPETSLAAPLTIGVSVMMGVCSNICVPVRTRFELPLDWRKSDPVQLLRLDRAVAKAPVPWTAETGILPLTDPVFDKKRDGLTLGYDPDRIDPARLFVTLGQTGLIFGAPRVEPGPFPRLFVPLLNKDRAETGLEHPLTFIFMTPQGAYSLVEKAASG